MKPDLRQLLYVSSAAASAGPIDLPAICARSRANNGQCGVTGLLYSDGARFLQVLEGPAEAVEATFTRIREDRRHRAVVVLQDRIVAEREFGQWLMAYRTAGDDADRFDDEMRGKLADASASVRGTFMGLIAARRQARSAA